MKMGYLQAFCCSSSSNHNILVPSTTTFPSPTTVFAQASSPNHRPVIAEPQAQRRALALGKRKLSLSSLALMILTGLFADSPMAVSAEELERYTDSMEGFTLLRPSSWDRVLSTVFLCCLLLKFSIFIYFLFVILFLNG